MERRPWDTERHDEYVMGNSVLRYYGYGDLDDLIDQMIFELHEDDYYRYGRRVRPRLHLITDND